MLTYDEEGGYPHPDHVMCHKISVVAFDAAGDPDRYPDEGPPWQPLKLYYHMGFTKERIVALHEALLAAGLESPYGEWLENWDPERDKSDRVTTRVECGDYFEQRDDALRAHATQVDPDGFWFRVPREFQMKHWPTEDYELVRSLVDSAMPGRRPVRRGPRARSTRGRAAYRDGVDGFAENNFGDTRSGSLAGPMGLLIIVLLAIATVLLIRNMNKRLRRLPERFPEQDRDPPDQPTDRPPSSDPDR